MTNQPSPQTSTLRLALLCIAVILASGCSMSQMVVRTSSTILTGGVEAMDRETDLELAKAAIPTQLKLLEGMIAIDPGNTQLRNYAAQALYGYAFGFVELDDRPRAGTLYRRCFDHAAVALARRGVRGELANWQPDQLKQDVDRLGTRAIPTLFWAASCLAKWIDMNRDDPGGIVELGNAAVLMNRVLELQADYYYGSPDIFFGVYYGSRAPMFGGDYEKSAQHFRRANAVTGGRFLLADVMYAEFLARQTLNRQAFHDRLARVIEAPDDLFPEQALANALAKDRARRLLQHESEWF